MGLALRLLTSQTTRTLEDTAPPRRPFRLLRALSRFGGSRQDGLSNYQLLDFLGRGARGFDVYKARDLALDRTVVVKLLVSDRPLREEDREIARRDAEAVAALRHPNLCPVFEVGETREGVLFIAMACCEGESLAEQIARGPLEIQAAVDLAAQIADGLARVHEAGVVHRNLKPSDVIVAPDGRAWITDFGLGRFDERTLVSGEGGEMPSAYLSPEQLRGDEPDARSDVWGLGAVLYEMVTGRRAFPNGPGTGAEAPVPMSRLREGVPAELQKIVSRALAFRSMDRYPSARQMASDLRNGVQPGAWRSGEAHGSFGPYRIAGVLGGGGMGVVYRAEDPRLGRRVAIKLLPPGLTRDPEAKARFLQEARAASSLDHPNLCTVYEVGEAGTDQLYLAMPCYDGETLRHRLDAGPLPVSEAVDCVSQLLKGLSKAHRNGIVHRDVKPANLMITDDGVVKILDFGIAKLAGSVNLDQAGTRVGTPAYMAPEQSRGEEVDARADLWSVGVVLYEMLTGTRPDPAAPAPLRRLRPEAPSELEPILRRLLARDRRERYASAEAVLADLRVLTGTMTGVSAAVELVPVARRSLRIWLGAALALVVLGLGAGYWLGAATSGVAAGTPASLARPAVSP